MSMTFGTVTLVLASLLSLFTTATAAANPAKFAKQLGLAIDNAGGTNEIRSQYAGFFLAVAIAGGAAVLGIVPRREALAVIAVVFGGLFVGRVFSLILNNGFAGYGPAIRALCFIDALGLALSIASFATGN